MPDAPWRAAGFEVLRDPRAPGDALTLLVTDPAQVPLPGAAEALARLDPPGGTLVLLGSLARVAAAAGGPLGGEASDAAGALLAREAGGCLAWRGRLGFDPRAPDAPAELALCPAFLRPDIRVVERPQRARRGGARLPRLALKCPAPDAARAHRWGDWHLARSLAGALAEEGVETRIDLADEWDLAGDADAALVLRGVRPWRPWPKLLNLMWLISHPDRVGEEELRGYDHVFVASRSEAARLGDVLAERVEPLLQCADPAFARLGPDPQVPAHPLLFVGNSRRQDRWVVSAALAAGHDVAVYGHEWEGRLPPGALRGAYVPNEALPAYYRAAGIVLNDHWPSMAERGFVSNRLMDVGMAGGFVLSDAFDGADGLGPGVETAADAAALDAAIRRWQADPAGRAARAAAWHAEVAARHGVADRAARIAAVIHAMT